MKLFQPQAVKASQKTRHSTVDRRYQVQEDQVNYQPREGETFVRKARSDDQATFVRFEGSKVVLKDAKGREFRVPKGNFACDFKRKR